MANTAYKTSKPSNHKAKTTASASGGVVEAANTPATPLCSPAAHYQLPTAITPQRVGLQTVIDAPHLYAVYGNTLAQINSQIDRCTPVVSTGTGGKAGKYAANTGNSVSWKISYADNGTGNCQILDADVTLHISQSFPSWQPTAGSPASLNSAWQTYIAKLHAYEQGHVNLDEQWANKLLSDLQNLPATNCQTIGQAATSKANADIAGSLAANANYDVVNDFGLKQNVVL